MKRFSPLPRARGFTLIELAVVVLIIALIAGVALPTFFRHRERATDRTMISDLVSAKKLALTYYMDRLGGEGSFSGFDPDSEPEWSSNITWGAPLANGQIGVISTSRNDRTWTLIEVAQPVDTDAGTIPAGTWVGNNTPDTWTSGSDAEVLAAIADHIDADGDGVADNGSGATENLLTPPGSNNGASDGSSGSGGEEAGEESSEFLYEGPTSLVFDGSEGDGVDTGVGIGTLAASGTSGAYSIAMWVTVDSPNADNDPWGDRSVTLLEHYWDDGNDMCYLLISAGGSDGFGGPPFLFARFYGSEGIAEGFAGIGSYETGVPFHLAFTYDNGDAVLFLDGEPLLSGYGTGAGCVSDGYEPLRLPQYMPGGSTPFIGELSDITFLDYALSAGDVANLAAN